MIALRLLLLGLWLALSGHAAASGNVTPESLANAFSGSYGTCSGAGTTHVEAAEQVRQCLHTYFAGQPGACAVSKTLVGNPSDAQTMVDYVIEHQQQSGLCTWQAGAVRFYASGTTTTCPANSTGNATPPTVCTCSTGYVPGPGGTSCVPQPDACAAKLGVALTGEIHIPVAGGYITPGSTCFEGCTYAKTFDSGGGWSRLGTAWEWWGSGKDFIGNGASCTAVPTGTGNPDEPAAAPKENPPPKGKCQTSLGGAVASVECDETATAPGGAIAPPPPGASGGAPGPGEPGAQGPGSFSGAASSPAPSGAKPGESGTSTSCSGDTCVTTECVIVLKPDLSMEKQCGSVGEDKGTYCKNNPGSPNCATAAEEEKEKECEDSAFVSCAKLGTLQPGAALGVQNKTLAITPTQGWNNATGCPEDRVLTVKGLTLRFPFTFLCDAADLARPVVIGMAWLSAAFAFIGFARKAS